MKWPLWGSLLSGRVNAWLSFAIITGESRPRIICPASHLTSENYSITTHEDYLRENEVFQVQRNRSGQYPYKGHGQPLLAYLAFSGCIFLLVVAGGAALWNGFHELSFLATYLTVRWPTHQYVVTFWY